MKVSFRASFEKDLRDIRDTNVHKKIRGAIIRAENAADVMNLPNVKKLAGKGPFYRIRIGDYRIGIEVRSTELTFVRALHRKDMYRFFP